MAVNPDKLDAFMGKAVGDIGSALSANMVLLGDKLGLYKAMAKAGPVTPAELAKATKTAERYVREWLGNQAAGGYVAYDAETGRYQLLKNKRWHSPMNAVPVFCPGRFRSSRPHFQPIPRLSNGSRPARASGGISTITDCLKAQRGSFVRTTWATS
jgi:winged helix-turn-helix protein